VDLLDDPQALGARDPGGMLQAILDLPAQCRRAWREALALHLPYKGLERMVVLGMGGSAIAADYLAAICQRPVVAVRGYHLPPWVDETTLVVASSYSGQTEETISAFQEALASPVPKVVITSGGHLLSLAQEHGIPAFVISYKGQPRAALGYSLMPLLAIAQKAGLLDDLGPQVEEALTLAEREAKALGPGGPDPRARDLARRLHGRLPAAYASQHLVPVARRFKTQLNENAKAWAFFEELPEADHNAVLAYRIPQAVARLALLVFIRAEGLHPRVELRYRLTRRLAEEAGVETMELTAPGISPLAQMLSATVLCDLASCYLAFLNDVDPTPVPEIDRLKSWMAQYPQ